MRTLMMLLIGVARVLGFTGIAVSGPPEGFARLNTSTYKGDVLTINHKAEKLVLLTFAQLKKLKKSILGIFSREQRSLYWSSIIPLVRKRPIKNQAGKTKVFHAHPKSARDSTSRNFVAIFFALNLFPIWALFWYYYSIIKSGSICQVMNMGRRMFIKKFVSLLILVLLISSTAKAENSQPYTLDSLIQEALTSNPEILSTKNAFESASARIPQARSLNDPMIEFEYDRITADRMLSGDPMKTFSVSQDIPFPTKLYLRAKIASKLAKMAYENYTAKERDVISQVKSAYSELALIYKEIEIDKENKDVLDQFSKTATARYGAGRGTQADALKAQVELARVNNELIMLEQKRVTAQARLNVLLNRDPKTDFGVPLAEPAIKFNRTLDDFYRLTLDSNPELKAYQYAIDRGQAAYDLSLNEFMPDFTFKFKQMVDNGRAESGAWAGMVGVTIPLWFFEKQSFGVKEMKSDLEMVKAEYKGKENSVLFEVNDAYARAVANKKLIELYETAFIPQAQEARNVALKGYETEKSDFLTVLDSQRMLINFELDHYRAILDLRIALADLERTVGADVDF